MAEVKNGDVHKLAVLFERYNKPLFSFFVHMNGNRELAEDLVQDVFFRMLRYRHTFDQAHPFTAWMYRIARNALTDHLRKGRPEVSFETNFSDEAAVMKEPVSSAPGAEEEFRRAQETRLLRRALSRLSEEKREILI